MTYNFVLRLLLASLLFTAGSFSAAAYTTNDVNTLFTAYGNAYYSLNGTNAYFKDNQTGGTTYFWGQAEEIECVIDAYECQSNANYKVMISNLLNGFAKNNGTNWSYNPYNDDCMWACMAYARGYLNTGNLQFRNIAKWNFDMVYARGWDTTLGGMWWTIGDTNKVAAVNGPASIAANLLYQSLGDSSYLAKATGIYNWEKTNLFVASSGMIYDGENINGTPGGGATTYNQGTFIGAANFLGQTNDAILAANYTLRSMTSSGILPQYGVNNNNSGFNAIFFRWMSRFMRDRGLQNTYQSWLQDNANAAWNNRRAADNLSWCQWRQPTPNDTNLYSWDCIASFEALQVLPPTQSTARGFVQLLADDPVGTNSFNSIGNWSDDNLPRWNNNYVVNGFDLRTPADSTFHNFAGGALLLTNGGALRLTTSSSAIITVGTILSLDNGIVSAWTRPAILGGNIVLQSGGGVFDPQGLGGFTINAPISGPGTLTVASDNNTFGGTLFLSGNNTYAGGTVINGPDTLTLTNNGSLGSTNGSLIFTNSGAGLTIPHAAYGTPSYGTLNLNGLSLALGSLAGGGGRIANNNATGTVTLTIGNDNGGGKYQGTVTDHTIGTGLISLVKAGAGTVTLANNTNNCGGGLTVTGGILVVSNAALSLGTGTGTSLNVGSGNFSSGILSSTLDMSAASNFVANVDTIQIGVNAATAGTVSGSAGTLNLGTNNSLTATISMTLGDSAGAFNTTPQTATTAANGSTTILTPRLVIGGRKANTIFTLGSGAHLTAGLIGKRTSLGVGNAAALGPVGTGTGFWATNDLSAGTFTGILSQLIIGTINNNGTGGETGVMILGTNAPNHLDLSGPGNVLLLGTNSTGTAAAGTGMLSLNNLDASSLIASTDNNTAILLGATINSVGSLNLNNSTLTITTTSNAIAGGAGTSTLNLDNVVLKAGAGSASFITHLTAANVNAGGVVFDTTSYDLAIDQPLLDGGGSGGVTKIGAGKLTLSKANTYAGNTIVSSGTLALAGNGTINNSSTLAISNGAALEVTGKSDQTLTIGNGGTLTGSGTIAGNVRTFAGSLIRPGDSIGTLTIQSNLTLGGALLMELDRTNAQNCDQVAVFSGNLTAGGTLTITNLGPALQTGDTFQLFNLPVSGFNSVNLPVLPLGEVWTNQLAVNGSVSVIANVSTVPTNLVAQVTGGSLLLSWPANHTGWRLQSQTNTLSIGLGTNWADVAGSTNDHQITIPLDNTAGSVFFRLTCP